MASADPETSHKIGLTEVDKLLSQRHQISGSAILAVKHGLEEILKLTKYLQNRRASHCFLSNGPNSFYFNLLTLLGSHRNWIFLLCYVLISYNFIAGSYRTLALRWLPLTQKPRTTLALLRPMIINLMVTTAQRHIELRPEGSNQDHHATIILSLWPTIRK